MSVLRLNPRTLSPGASLPPWPPLGSVCGLCDISRAGIDPLLLRAHRWPCRFTPHPVTGGQARALHQVGDALLLVLW